MDGRLSKHPITKQLGNGASLGVKDLGMMLRSFLFLLIVNVLLFIKSWISNQSLKSERGLTPLIICTGSKKLKDISLKSNY